ncbi:MAG: prenyltransferase/squalene oxidase repeat-containing protein [Pirellulaceae bacterium]
MPAYLESLTLRLALGLESLPDDARQRHATFLKGFQQPDGGFRGREGGSDLYYTGFALRGLALLGHLEGEVADRAAAYLRSQLSRQVPMVDFLSLIYGAALLNFAAGIDVFEASAAGWQQNIAAALEAFRREDGGYAKTDEGAASSMYHTFLVVLSQQLIEQPVIEPERIAAFVRSRKRDDGGFVEMPQMKRSGTNPTAAAIGLLRILDALDESTRESTLDFLVEMQTDEGGLRANTRIPIADLLSTFTGCLTLADLGALDEIDVPAIRRYARELEQPAGGFLGAIWDEVADVEYTFYGLGTIALTGGFQV